MPTTLWQASVHLCVPYAFHPCRGYKLPSAHPVRISAAVVVFCSSSCAVRRCSRVTIRRRCRVCVLTKATCQQLASLRLRRQQLPEILHLTKPSALIDRCTFLRISSSHQEQLRNGPYGVCLQIAAVSRLRQHEFQAARLGFTTMPHCNT